MHSSSCVFFLKTEAISQSVATRDTRKPEARDAWGYRQVRGEGAATRDTWGTYIQARGEGEEGYRGWWVVCGSAEELVRREREGKALPFGAAHEGMDLRTTAWEPCEEGDHKTTGRTVTEPQNTSQHTVVLSDIGREGIHMTNEENHC